MNITRRKQRHRLVALTKSQLARPFLSFNRIIPVFITGCLSGFQIFAPPFACAAELQEKLVINRRECSLSVFDASGKPVLTSKIGIGRGGAFAVKRSMLDNVTPTGQFHIDIILCRDADYDQVDEALLPRYRTNRKFESLLKSKKGLGQLFDNMNSLDFNQDGKPDGAYGYAYLGLDSRQALSGPKMSSYKGTPYWFSIALHGTSDEAKNIGAANSGGCIHVPGAVLRELIRAHLVKVGTRVIVE